MPFFFGFFRCIELELQTVSRVSVLIEVDLYTLGKIMLLQEVEFNDVVNDLIGVVLSGRTTAFSVTINKY